jgi:16S rRNA (uracil1498-N3)-methyltransferase
MRPHRAFVAAITPTITLSGSESDHLRVLRAQVGDSLTVFDGQGFEAKAAITKITTAMMVLTTETIVASQREPKQPIIVGLALLKGDKLSDIVRAGCELGATSFQLLVTEHCEAREIGAQKLERLRRVALEAAKQCQRAVTPTVEAPLVLKELPAAINGIVAHPYSSQSLLHTLPLLENIEPPTPLWLVTGPEGGLSEREVAMLQLRGLFGVQLGPRILRAETAPLVVLAGLTALQGE